MANFWWDYFRLWKIALGTPDPASRKAYEQPATGAAVTLPDAIGDVRQDGLWSGGNRGLIRLRETSEFVDLSSV